MNNKIIESCARAIHNADNPEYTYKWGGLNFDKQQYDTGIDRARACLKVLVDNIDEVGLGNAVVMHWSATDSDLGEKKSMKKAILAYLTHITRE